MTGLLIRRGNLEGFFCAEETPGKDTKRSQPSTRQGERPQKKPTLPTLRSQLLASRTVRK